MGQTMRETAHCRDSCFPWENLNFICQCGLELMDTSSTWFMVPQMRLLDKHSECMPCYSGWFLNHDCLIWYAETLKGRQLFSGTHFMFPSPLCKSNSLFPSTLNTKRSIPFLSWSFLPRFKGHWYFPFCISKYVHTSIHTLYVLTFNFIIF